MRMSVPEPEICLHEGRTGLAVCVVVVCEVFGVLLKAVPSLW